MENAYSLQQISAAITEARPRFIRLTAEDSSVMIPWNPLHKTGFDAAHLKKIIDRLKAGITPQGHYYVCFCETISKNGNSQKLLFTKGTPATVAPVTVPNAPALSPDKILELVEKNATLTAKVSQLETENAALKEENTKLQEELDDLETELDNQPEEKTSRGLFEGEEMKAKIHGLLDGIIAKWAEPSSPAAPAPAPAAGPLNGHAVTQIPYEALRDMVLNVPGVLEQLRKDVQAHNEKINANGTPAQ